MRVQLPSAPPPRPLCEPGHVPGSRSVGRLPWPGCARVGVLVGPVRLGHAEDRDHLVRADDLDLGHERFDQRLGLGGLLPVDDLIDVGTVTSRKVTSPM